MDKYGQFLGQIVSKQRSSVFLGKSTSRKQSISELMDISQGTLPFNYFGPSTLEVPLKASALKRLHVKFVQSLHCGKAL